MATKRNLGELKAAVVKHDFEVEEDIDTELTTWINDGYMEIAKEDLPCFLKKDLIVTQEGENEYWLSGDYRLMEVMYLEDAEGDTIDFYHTNSLFYYDNYNVENMDASEYSKGLKAIILSETLGIKFNRKFDNTYNIYYYYYHVPDRMVDDDNDYPIIPSLYDNLLVQYANAMYRKRERDFQAYREELGLFRSDLLNWVIKSRNKVKGQHDMIEDARSYYRKKGGII